MLELQDLVVTRSDGDRRFALRVAQLSIAPGDVVGLTGASGTGKTLLLEVLGLLRRPDAGRYVLHTGAARLTLSDLWAGAAWRDAPMRRAQSFGFVPQSGGLLPFLSVSENVALGQRVKGLCDPALVEDLLARLGLADVASLLPAALSIGQRQRVAIARALAHRPQCVIADEPTAALDPDAARSAMELLLDAARSEGAGVLVSSHDVALLDQFDMRRVALSALAGQARGETVTSTLGGEAAA